MSSTRNGAPNFEPSHFGGVMVRHVPDASPQAAITAASTKPRRGLVLKNVRRAPNPRDGVMADVDPSSFPAQIATIGPKKK